MIDKLCSLSALAGYVEAGDTLALGGVTIYRRPVAFVRELLHTRPEATDLTLLCFTAGYESDLLVGCGRVARVRTCYFGLEIFGLAPMFSAAANKGEIEVVEESEASLSFGLRAALAQVGFMPGRGWLGTDLPKLRPDVRTIIDPYSGEELMAFPAIRCDVAVIHALQADPSGNAVIGGNSGVDFELAALATHTLITAEEIVPRLARADISGVAVTAVAHAPRGAWPTSCHPAYALGGGELLNYIEACNRGDFEAYVAALGRLQPASDHTNI